MLRLHSSLRIRTPEETFRIARQYLSRLGITRVTESTYLDRIGIPVYAAIRPAAAPGSLIVTAGKGMTREEARIGALMEAIELAFAEPGNSAAICHPVRAGDMLASPFSTLDILDLCPVAGVGIPAGQYVAGVFAEDLISGTEIAVPAELVFVPSITGEPEYFGYNTNGLASGNSRVEAVIHGILEVVERDILSFDMIYERSSLVLPETLPEEVSDLSRSIEDAGLELIVRTVDNAWGFPFFKTFLLDPERENPVFISAGFGCHTERSIALVRAVTESVQSRMAFIHGGRDDLEEQTGIYDNLDFRVRSKIFGASAAALRSRDSAVRYHEIPDLAFGASSPEAYLERLVGRLHSGGEVPAILCAYHTSADEALHVVKVIIPRMEFYNRDSNRIGRRLSTYIHEMAYHDHLRGSES